MAVLLLAQSITVVEAKHKAADNGEARAAMKAKSTTFDEKVTSKSATKEQKRAVILDELKRLEQESHMRILYIRDLIEEL